MLMIIYVFAVLFRQLTDGTELGATRFHFIFIAEFVQSFKMLKLILISKVHDLTRPGPRPGEFHDVETVCYLRVVVSRVWGLA